MPVIWMELPAARGEESRETAASGSQGKKVCQEEEAVGSISSRPQTMGDVELKVSTGFSNKEVRGGRERPASGAWRGQSQTEGGGS